MNLPEFKAWFSGFTENLDGPPTAKQWARIAEKVEAIKDAPAVTVREFHDYHYRPWRRWYDHDPRTLYAVGSSLEARPGDLGMFEQGLSCVAEQSSAGDGGRAEFDSGTAFRAAGLAEARSMGIGR